MVAGMWVPGTMGRGSWWRRSSFRDLSSRCRFATTARHLRSGSIGDAKDHLSGLPHGDGVGRRNAASVVMTRFETTGATSRVRDARDLEDMTTGVAVIAAASPTPSKALRSCRQGGGPGPPPCLLHASSPLNCFAANTPRRYSRLSRQEVTS